MCANSPEIGIPGKIVQIEETCTCALEARILNQAGCRGIEFAHRVTERNRGSSDGIFQPLFASGDFFPSLGLGQGFQRNMIHGMSADLELASKLPNLSRGHYRTLGVLGWNIERSLQAILTEQFRCSQVRH